MGIVGGLNMELMLRADEAGRVRLGTRPVEETAAAAAGAGPEGGEEDGTGVVRMVLPVVGVVAVGEQDAERQGATGRRGNTAAGQFVRQSERAVAHLASRAEEEGFSEDDVRRGPRIGAGTTGARQGGADRNELPVTSALQAVGGTLSWLAQGISNTWQNRASVFTPTAANQRRHTVAAASAEAVDRSTLPRPSSGTRQQLRTLQNTLQAAVDPASPTAERMLFELWHTTFCVQEGTDAAEFPFPADLDRRSPLWCVLGFQTSTPFSDFRAAGLLGLSCLAHFAINFTPLYLQWVLLSHVLGTSVRAIKPFPFAVAGINVVVRLAAELGLDNKFGLYPIPAEHWALFAGHAAFNELFAVAMLLLEHVRVHRQASMMEFSQVLDEAIAILFHMLNQCGHHENNATRPPNSATSSAATASNPPSIAVMATSGGGAGARPGSAATANAGIAVPNPKAVQRFQARLWHSLFACTVEEACSPPSTTSAASNADLDKQLTTMADGAGDDDGDGVHAQDSETATQSALGQVMLLPFCMLCPWARSAREKIRVLAREELATAATSVATTRTLPPAPPQQQQQQQQQQDDEVKEDGKADGSPIKASLLFTAGCHSRRHLSELYADAVNNVDPSIFLEQWVTGSAQNERYVCRACPWTVLNAQEQWTHVIVALGAHGFVPVVQQQLQQEQPTDAADAANFSPVLWIHRPEEEQATLGDAAGMVYALRREPPPDDAVVDPPSLVRVSAICDPSRNPVCVYIVTARAKSAEHAEIVANAAAFAINSVDISL